MLAPDSQFQFFLSDDWEPEWRNTYRKAFQSALVPYQERLSNGQGPQNYQVQTKTSSRLNQILNRNKTSAKPVQDKATQYLDSGIVLHITFLFATANSFSLLDLVDADPLHFWQDNQSRYPTIALPARDILSIPATGAGVERLFNTARDVCHYQHGRLRSETVEEIMLYLCTTRFDLNNAEAKQLEKFFILEEIEAAREQNHECHRLWPGAWLSAMPST
jgi:uncharacterized protein (UPF0305 family)